MLQRYGGLLVKDIVTAFRNYFVLIVLGVALLFVGLTNFLIPEELTLKPSVYYLIRYDGEMRDIIDQNIQASAEKHDNMQQVNSIEEIEARMRKNFNSLGMVVKGENHRPHIEFILQGHENQKVIDALVLSVKDDLRNRLQGDIAVPTIYLNRETEIEKIPFNLTMIPIFIVMESVLVGFFLIAALTFMEKDEGTIRAYLVSPGKMPEYLASKITLMLLLGCMSALVLVSLTMGGQANYLSILAFVALGSIAAAISGLMLASFFDNISQASVWIIVVSIVLALPFMSYYFPSFAPALVKLIPTYPLLFTAREILFPTGNAKMIYSTLLGLCVFNILGYIAVVMAYRLNIRKD